MSPFVMNKVTVFTTGGAEVHRETQGSDFRGHYLRTGPPGKIFSIFLRKFLHLWRFAVISLLRTNFAENARESLCTWEPRKGSQGRRGGESESPEEEAIEIGNSYRNH